MTSPGIDTAAAENELKTVPPGKIVVGHFLVGVPDVQLTVPMPRGALVIQAL